MFSLKNLNFACDCVCVCVCLCVCVYMVCVTCVCAYVYVCINVTNQNNVIIATAHRVLTNFLKFINWKYLKVFHLYMTQIFTCLKFCYISSFINMCTLKQS